MLSAAVVLLFVVSALFCSFIYLYKNYGRRPTTIPGPDLVDLKYGHLGEMKKAGGIHDYLIQLHKEYGSIVSFWMGTEMVVSIESPELFKENMTVFDRPSLLFEFAEPMIGRTSVQFANGADGKRRRALYDRSFSYSACMQYQKEFQKISEELAEQWSQSPKEEQFPLRKHMMAVAVKGITRTCFGSYFKDDQNVYEFTTLYDKVMKVLDERFLEPESELKKKEKLQYKEAEDFKAVVKKFIKYREEHQSEMETTDFLDVLMNSSTDEDVMVSDAITFVVGGFHTTGGFLTWAMYLLACCQDVQEKVYQEVKKVFGDEPFTLEKFNDLVYTRQVMDETLRWSVIGPYAARILDTETKLGGHVIPANTPIIHALGPILKDEKYWPEPDKFDPERFSEEAVQKRPKLLFEPFGFAGKRKCPGYRFTYVEVAVCISVLIRKFVIHLVEGQNVNAICPSIITRPEEEIWIYAVPRSE